MNNLTTLRLYKCEGVTDKSFAKQNFENLRECYINKCPGLTRSFEEEHKFKKIEIMNFFHNKRFGGIYG
jgi:hypothetical protein